MTTLKHVLAQIDAAKGELELYAPDAIDWHARCRQTAKELIPWLQEHATAMRDFVLGVANAPSCVQAAWERLRAEVTIPPRQAQQFAQSLVPLSLWTEKVSGTVLSRAIERFITHNFPEHAILPNGHSDFPDLYFKTRDYSSLPRHTRQAEQVYEACLKGPLLRPCRVPDGVEIKTCNNTGNVDCHHAHSGLHIALEVSSVAGEPVEFKDIRVGFLRAQDYRKCEVNTAATTTKASFRLGDKFRSIMPG